MMIDTRPRLTMTRLTVSPRAIVSRLTTFNIGTNMWAKRVFFALSFILAGAAVAQAQTGSVTGTVVDSATSQLLPNVRVSVVGTSLTGGTNASGRFTIQGVPAGPQQLRGGGRVDSAEDGSPDAQEKEVIDERVRATLERALRIAHKYLVAQIGSGETGELVVWVERIVET